MDFVKISYDLGAFVRDAFGLVYGLIGIAWPVVAGLSFAIGWHIGRLIK